MNRDFPIGWVGLGAMGGPMARVALAAGFPVSGFDVAEEARLPFERAGGVTVVSPAAAARGADALVVMVATPAQVEEVLFGADGAAPALRPGAIVVITATVGDVVQGWAERLAALGVALVDAPVSGGVSRAAAGELLIMPSGSPTDLDRVRPLLESLASSATPVGDAAGDGQRMKLVNQLLCGVHIVAAAEALSFATALGLDPKAVRDVVRHGAAGSFMLDDRGARMLGDDPEVRSAVDIFVKDLGLVLSASLAAGHDAKLARAAGDVFLAASAAGLGRHDDSAVIRVYGAGGAPAAPVT